MEELKNPFAVQTPEDIPATDVIDLFSDVFSDFHNVLKQGHTFINGPRGTGKSMMFRFMQPDCQMLRNSIKDITNLSYFAIYIPLKKNLIIREEIERLNEYAYTLINEHLLILHFSLFILDSLKKLEIKSDEHIKAVLNLHNNEFINLIKNIGYKNEIKEMSRADSYDSVVDSMISYCKFMNNETINYINSLALSTEVKDYNGAIATYNEFLYPLLYRIKNLEFMPRGPIFLLIDDADNLNDIQTKILNTWVSFRTSADISLKISSIESRYKTYKTLYGPTIDSPHDYSEVNIDTIYTSSKKKYKERTKDIIERRLKKYNINKTAEEFFPEDVEQENKIKEIYAEIFKSFEDKGRGNTPYDDANRYARPNYIKSLKGTAKSGHSYSYAGFNQLVHISSGIIRYFLEAASLMFGSMKSAYNNVQIDYISPRFQNSHIREYSDNFLFKEIDKMKKDETDKSIELDKPQKLNNLINSLGGMFHKILISNAAERRVFSVALSDPPNNDIEEVFKLGLKYGFFQESSIGNKQGTGRTKLYILSRRFAPAFLLDPTSFAGYKFLRNDDIRLAMENPQKFIRNIEEKLETETDQEIYQLTLFEI